MVLQLAMILGTSTGKDTLISTARNLLYGPAVLNNVEHPGQRIAAQSICKRLSYRITHLSEVARDKRRIGH
jgi:hypothetical protein